jgi:hypothetical protein
MRKLTPLVGLFLFALAGSASAEETAPAAAATPAPAAEATPAPAAPPADAAAAVEAVALAASAAQRKWQVGLAFLPMAVGKYKYSDTYTSTASSDMYFGYGIGVSAGYQIWRGLVVGIAPQVIFNVQPKPMEGTNPKVAKEYDLMARVAYELRFGDGIALYAEALPGYSRIAPSDETTPSNGFVVAFGAGCSADLTDRFFLNVGGGYQIGFQNQIQGVHTMLLRSRYVRVAMGGGVRF